VGGATGAIKLASGLLVILFGLNLIFDFLKLLNLEARFHAERPARKGLGGLAGAFVVGLAFAAGWSPCIGPILASILLLAAREASLGRAALLLSAYSLGLALPFLASGLAYPLVKPLFEKAKRRGGAIRIGAGILLLSLGGLMALGMLGAVSGIAARAGQALASASAESPGAVLAVDLSLWGLLLCLVALPGLVGRLRGRRFSRPRLVVLGLLGTAIIGEALGLWSAAAALAGWLSFQGP
jgi:cytochrome c-type biogenesis protein